MFSLFDIESFQKKTAFMSSGLEETLINCSLNKRFCYIKNNFKCRIFLGLNKPRHLNSGP